MQKMLLYRLCLFSCFISAVTHSTKGLMGIPAVALVLLTSALRYSQRCSGAAHMQCVVSSKGSPVILCRQTENRKYNDRSTLMYIEFPATTKENVRNYCWYLLSQFCFLQVIAAIIPQRAPGCFISKGLNLQQQFVTNKKLFGPIYWRFLTLYHHFCLTFMLQNSRILFLFCVECQQRRKWGRFFLCC